MRWSSVPWRAAAIGVVALSTACERPTDAPLKQQSIPLATEPALAVTGGPDLSDPLSFEGELWICKDGNGTGVTFDFAWSIRIAGPGGAPYSSGNVSVPIGTCVLAAAVPTSVSQKYRATVTELAPPPDWYFTGAESNYGGPRGIIIPTIDLTTRTASGIPLSNDLGVQVTMFNNFDPKVGQLGDFVWNDLNGNGIQDSGEPGIAGVTVTLGGAASATTTTDANGFYLFSNLGAGAYTVTVATPSGFTPSPSSAGGDPTMDSNGSPASVTLPTNSSTDLSIDFGFTKGLGSIGDFVWNDLNGNGIQDSGEPGLAGVTVTLGGAATATTTTDGNGFYQFTNLFAGNYTVTVGTPAGYAPSPSNQGGDPTKDSNGSPASVTLATNTSSDQTIDFGFVQNKTGQIGDFVWYDVNGNGVQDPSEPGLAGITVTLTGPVNATTTTSATGAYLFTGLPAGSYTVTVATPSGYTPSPSNQGGDPTKDSNGSPASVTLATNTSSDLTIDFGFTRPMGTIGDFVWNDLNGNGVQDSGEPGIAGITVTLGGAASGTTTTDGTGKYLFTGLFAGSYTVTVGTPPGYSASPSNQGGDPTRDSNGSPASVTLATNISNDLSIDFGFVEIKTGKIGDFVWNDVNGNGVQDPSEPGIAGVTVTLGGAATATTTTDANGQYLFSNLGAGTYTVTVGTPSGFTPSPSNQGGDPAKDSNGSPATVVLATNTSSDLTIDFGFTKPLGSIGDFVWQDLNGNGVQDAGEPGIPGVTVTLGGAKSATTTTGANGQYQFTNLFAGSYTVTVGTPAGYAPTPSNQGGDPSKDSNGSPASVTLATNSSSDQTIDFGYVPLGSIGDRVWSDTNGDGVQDPGEPGLNGVTVQLKDQNGNVVQTLTTGGDGIYTFNNVPAGTWKVCVVPASLPAGYTPTYDLDGVGTANCATFPLGIGQDRTDVDFGYQPPPTNACVAGPIGGINLGGLPNYLFVWTDGSTDANWQGATKGFAGDAVVNGILAKERTSGDVPYAGTIFTNDVTLGAWERIVNDNAGQAFAAYSESARVAQAKSDLLNAMAQINGLTVTPGFASRSATSLNGLSTVNGIAETTVINVTSGFNVSSKINITGDVGDVFVLRWDTDANFANGYQGQVKFQSGGAIVPQGGLTPGSFIHVAGDLNASGGGSNPPAPYPQGPRLNNGLGSLVQGGKDWKGGGFFTGYWLTTGDPSSGQTAPFSNAIFVGGWYSLTNKFSMTSGTSGVHVCPIP